MRYKRLRLSAILLLGLGLTGLKAQESVNVTGGNASGSGGTVNYSIGHVTYQTYTGTNGSLAEGVQQPYEISVISTIIETIKVNLSVSAYPNPTTDNLILSIDEFDLSNLLYQLYDLNGEVLQNGKITSDQTILELGNLVPSTYFVKVTLDCKEVKTFKIIKP